jgi:murein DD-endopeptidase MepM/ murein hydrolase activator NlpD
VIDFNAEYWGASVHNEISDGSTRKSFLPLPRKISALRHLRWLALALALPIAGGMVYRFTSPTLSVPDHVPVTVTILDHALQLPQHIVQPIGDVIETVVRRNDTLDRIFRQAKLNLDDLAAIRNLPGIRNSLDALKPGELIKLNHIDGALQNFSRRLSETQLLSVRREAAGFKAEIIETPLEIRTAASHGIIETSLFNAARSAGIRPEVIMRLANDVFGWDIDFALEIQEGDRFGVLYEQKYREGEYVSDGQILAADFVNQGREYRAVHFISADGVINDYFTPEGKSVRKQFLRAPVEFKYISSGFNPHRLHPILNIVRAHQGVDYSAPTGTPVRAAGDGRISFRGVQGGYGNAVVLEHGGGVSTLYGHLSAFAKTFRDGARVKQGDVIGFVGSTGAATGPHLHYEYRVNGVHKNPRTVSLPDVQSIPEKYISEFDAIKSALLVRLEATGDSAVISER